ncbi:hypothetical protein F5B20DRAFT_588567 [Whalleya microplaca]|nr:hypothetical protein F5B20DRAFT_588567 [Whalleya microplaca]
MSSPYASNNAPMQPATRSVSRESFETARQNSVRHAGSFPIERAPSHHYVPNQNFHSVPINSLGRISDRVEPYDAHIRGGSSDTPAKEYPSHPDCGKCKNFDDKSKVRKVLHILSEGHWGGTKIWIPETLCRLVLLFFSIGLIWCETLIMSLWIAPSSVDRGSFEYVQHVLAIILAVLSFAWVCLCMIATGQTGSPFFFPFETVFMILWIVLAGALNTSHLVPDEKPYPANTPEGEKAYVILTSVAAGGAICFFITWFYGVTRILAELGPDFMNLIVCSSSASWKTVWDDWKTIGNKSGKPSKGTLRKKGQQEREPRAEV